MIKWLFSAFFVVIVASKFVYAQDPQFSQFYANRLYLNPAFAGEVACPRVIMNYRNQWPALGSTYVTYSFSADMYVSWLQGGLGINILRDNQGHGAITTSNISLMYSYNQAINRNFSIRAGFQAGYFQKRLDWDFIFPDMIHPLYGVVQHDNESIIQEEYLNQLNIGFVDFSAGLIGFSDNYYFGFAVHHLTAPVESHRENSDARLPRKYTVHFGTNIPITGRNLKKGELFISPNILFQQQRNFQQLNYGIYVNRKSFVIGLWLRQNFNFHYDSFIMIMGYSTKKWKIGYSYDMTVSKLRNQTLGAHEISLTHVFKCFSRPVRYEPMDCMPQ